MSAPVVNGHDDSGRESQMLQSAFAGRTGARLVVGIVQVRRYGAEEARRTSILSLQITVCTQVEQTERWLLESSVARFRLAEVARDSWQSTMSHECIGGLGCDRRAASTGHKDVQETERGRDVPARRLSRQGQRQNAERRRRFSIVGARRSRFLGIHWRPFFPSPRSGRRRNEKSVHRVWRGSGRPASCTATCLMVSLCAASCAPGMTAKAHVTSRPLCRHTRRGCG